VKNPPDQFTGDVWFDVIATPQDENQRMVVGLVRFAPGARTAWHSHANGQTVYTPPGEEHWHGATPDDFMEHLAMFETGDDPGTGTTWGAHVTDQEYNNTSRD
jgi:quercetin dioxygenase-like cupin family protein